MSNYPNPPPKGLYQLMSKNGQVYWESVSGPSPNPPPGPTGSTDHLFILAGQSNCQSANNGPIWNNPTGPDSVNSRVLQLSRGVMNKTYNCGQKDTWILAQDPLQHHLIHDDQSVGFGLTFAKNFLADHPNDRVYLLPCALGGSGFTPIDLGYGQVSWRKSFQGGLMNLYHEMIKSYQTAKKLLPNSVLSGVLWHQGESDIGNWSYQHDLNNFIKNCREDFGNPNLFFICGTMLKAFKDSNPQTQFVDSVHKHVPGTVWLGECAVFDDLTSPDMQADFVHYSAKAQRIMGQRYYQKWKVLWDKYQQALEEWNKKQ